MAKAYLLEISDGILKNLFLFWLFSPKFRHGIYEVEI